MVNIARITKSLSGIASDAFSRILIKAPVSSPEGEEKFAAGISKQASEAISSYGKASIRPKAKLLKTSSDYEEEMEILLKKAGKTKQNDTISLKDAVKELDMLDLQESQKADLLLSCTFQTKTNETIISRPALYMAKYAIIDCYGKVPNKLDKAVRTAIYDEGKVFDVDYFYELFKRNTWTLKRSAELKKSPTGSSKLAHYNMARRGAIYDALRMHSTQRTQIKITTADIFTPLDKVGENLGKKLDALSVSGANIPKELVQTMKKALSEYNFDLKKVYADYYSLLKECETLEDVKTFYPELKFPTELKEKGFNTNTNIDLSIRMKEKGIDKPVIEALKKLYTELTPSGKTFISIDGSTSTNVTNLKRAGYEISEPDEGLLHFLRECELTQLKYRKISEISKDTLEPLIEKHALRNSGVWRDFTELTKSGKWMPIRLIKNKRAYPETTKYSTDRLVETYLFNLFLRNPYQRYSKNPLGRFGKINYLDERAQSLINRIYAIRYLTKEKDLPANIEWSDYAKIRSDFEAFKQQFDLDAISKSFEHMEDVYHKHFYRNYWSSDRLQILQKQIQVSQDIAYEKVLWGEELRQKEVNLDKVKQIVKSEEGVEIGAGIKLIDSKEFNNYKYQISKVKDSQLREKFMGAIAQGQESNEEYFNVFNKIIKESSVDGSIDEVKAQALINIHENYLSEIFEGAQNITESEYTQKFLANYKTSSGINYAKVVADTEAEANYWNLSSTLIANNSSPFLMELERRFKGDFVAMNEIMKKYISTPKVFQEKFSSIYLNSNPSCPNVVLQRELNTFLEQIEGWHFDKDEIIELGEFKNPQRVAIPKETKEKLWDLCAGNFENFDEIIQKLYRSGKKRTGETRGTGIKTWAGDDYDVELKILGKWGDYRLYAKEASTEDIEKYGNVKYVFKHVVKNH